MNKEQYGKHSQDPNKSMMQRMLDGELFIYTVPEILEEQARKEKWQVRFNSSMDKSLDEQSAILRERIGTMGRGATIRPPFYCDYGFNIHLGEDSYLNYNCHILDSCRVDIGPKCWIGPAVHIYTAEHPRDAETRAAGWEYGRPIRIGRNVWIGGSAIILSGITIGDNAIVGAGAVVTKDVPANTTVVGNPARPIKKGSTAENR